MKKNPYLVILVLVCFFVISLITNILGSIIPDFIHDFKINLTLVSLLPFSFFIAYGIASIPTGMLLEKIPTKKILFSSLLFMLIGAVLMVLFSTYHIAILSLFILGLGMASMQVVINPLLRVSGGEEHYNFFAILAQLIFGLASFTAPWIYKEILNQYSLHAQSDKSIPFLTLSFPWVKLYVLFIIIIIVLAIIVNFFSFPKLELAQNEKSGTIKTYVSLIKNKTVILYFFAMFFYIGTEQSIVNWVSEYFYVYYHQNSQTVGVTIVSFYWGAMTVGGVFGLLLVKIFDSRKVFIVFNVLAICSYIFALWGNLEIASVAFVSMGFFLSVMFPTIMSLALNSWKENHGSFAGILITGIIGGAVFPVIVGKLGDIFGLQKALHIIFINLCFILFIGIWARPLIKNKTIFDKKKNSSLSF